MIVMENINKLYTADQEQIHVLKNISLTIEEHEFVAVMGAIWFRKINADQYD